MAQKSVFGIVRTQTEAEALVADLWTHGFRHSDVSVVYPDKGAVRDVVHERGTKAPEGAVIGGATGGVALGALGVLAGIGAIAIPGLGALIAAGPVMAALGGAAVGAAAGSAIGALVGLGLPEIQAKIYEGKLRAGNVLVAVHTDDASWADRAKKIFETHNAQDVSVTSEASVPRDQRTNPGRNVGR
jgi:hypothetical protein